MKPSIAKTDAHPPPTASRERSFNNRTMASSPLARGKGWIPMVPKRSQLPFDPAGRTKFAARLAPQPKRTAALQAAAAWIIHVAGDNPTASAFPHARRPEWPWSGNSSRDTADCPSALQTGRLMGRSLTLAVVLLTITPGGLGRAQAESYATHEWGTFTSVQGADGVLVEWNPLETTRLPRFVYDWNKPGLNRLPAGALGPGSKSVFVTLQRMETPVIYFYSDKEQPVDVTVRFPQGLITE